jgi:hypothetical protein
MPERKSCPSVSDAGGFTTAPVVAQATQTATVRPEWIRLPKPGTLCPWTGLSRTKLWELIATGKVRSVCLRKEGAKKGARLVLLASLLSHLEALASEQTGETKEDG